MATEKRTLVEIAHYPEHGPRASDHHYTIFNAARRHLIDNLGVGCWVGGATKAQIAAGLAPSHICHGCSGLEAHHDIAEYSALSEIDWEKVRNDFPQLGIHNDEDFLRMAESEGGLLILCSIHHRHPGKGIHAITGPVWKLQRYALPDWDFTPETAKPAGAPQ
jgi:hypothetical protein